ncbi:MAG: hypothetical protein KIS90_13990 [Phenylobacterium sp.]|nr:hypothetical protein [Phenylobacterium sp.]
MSEAAQAVDAARRVFGKKQLCEALGWSRMKLDRRLESDPIFPVVTRGTQAGGWEFDVDLVLAYLGAQPDKDDGEDDGGDAPTAPPRVQHAAEETARSRLNNAQAELAMDRLRKQRGELVEVEPLRLALADAVTVMGQGLNTLPDQLVRLLNLPESAGPIIRQEVDQLRRQLHKALRDHLVGE